MSLVGFHPMDAYLEVNRESIQDQRLCYIVCRMVGQERTICESWAHTVSEEISLPQTDQSSLGM